MNIGTVFVRLDQLSDYVPFVSTASNTINLFQKSVYRFLPEKTQQNPYWTHIHNKEMFRCCILLVPILGNIYIAKIDFSPKAPRNAPTR